MRTRYCLIFLLAILTVTFVFRAVSADDEGATGLRLPRSQAAAHQPSLPPTPALPQASRPAPTRSLPPTRRTNRAGAVPASSTAPTLDPEPISTIEIVGEVDIAQEVLDARQQIESLQDELNRYVKTTVSLQGLRRAASLQEGRIDVVQVNKIVVEAIQRTIAPDSWEDDPNCELSLRFDSSENAVGLSVSHRKETVAEVIQYVEGLEQAMTSLHEAGFEIRLTSSTTSTPGIGLSIPGTSSTAPWGTPPSLPSSKSDRQNDPLPTSKLKESNSEPKE